MLTQHHSRTMMTCTELGGKQGPLATTHRCHPLLHGRQCAVMYRACCVSFCELVALHGSARQCRGCMLTSTPTCRCWSWLHRSSRLS
jgi:hypothetical protein